MQPILVTGATGNTGREIVRRLSTRGVAVRALVRSPDKAAALRELPHVEVVAGDMARPETLGAALDGVARAMLISSSNPQMFDVQASFIAAAASAQVPHVVKLSGIVADPESPFRFARMHGEIEQRLAASGVAYTNLRSGEFMHAYFRQVPSIVGKGALALPMADARIASIDIGDVAEVAVAVLTGDGHETKNYAITGPESLTMADVAERLSRAIGKPIRYIHVPPADARQARLAAGMPAYLADALDELFAERRKGVEAAVSPVVASVFGIQPTTFDEFVHRHLAIFRGEQPPPTV